VVDWEHGSTAAAVVVAAVAAGTAPVGTVDDCPNSAPVEVGLADP
jgi:hypothetical protein